MATQHHSGELLRASRAGDRAALEALLQQHLAGLRAFARLRMSPLLRARDSAEDIVQSACCEILLALEGFEYQGEEAFRAWLYTSVWNKLINKERSVRRQKRDARREVGLHGGSDGTNASLGQLYARVFTPSQVAMADERVHQLEAAFDALPDHYREVVTLSRVAQLSRAQIAERLGRSEGSVRNLITRALVELANQLKRQQR